MPHRPMGSNHGDAVEKVRMPNQAKLPPPQQAYHRNGTVANNCNFDKKVADALNSRMAESSDRWQCARRGMVFRPNGPAIPMAWANGLVITHIFPTPSASCGW